MMMYDVYGCGWHYSMTIHDPDRILQHGRKDVILRYLEGVRSAVRFGFAGMEVIYGNLSLGLFLQLGFRQS